MQHRYYIIYKTTDTLTGEYYIGQHRTNNLQDGYKGSGNWIRLKQVKKRELVTEVLHHSNRDSLCSDERMLIGSLWITDPYCMNQCPGGGSGPHKEITKKQISETRLRLGLKPNPKQTRGTSFMHKDGIQKRVPIELVYEYASLGWCKGRLIKPPKHTGKVWITKEDKQIRVDNPEAYLEDGWVIGRVSPTYKITICPHCNKSGGINVMKRWHLDRCKLKK
jgi:hypothetical protein